MQAQSDNSEVLNEIVGLNECKLLSTSFKEGDNNTANDSAFYEKFILDDLESYWDELNDRLNVMRMVSDSVTKGMVNAVVEEAAEKIATKEAEIAVLNKTLLSCKSNADLDDRLGIISMIPKRSLMNAGIDRTESRSRQGFLDASAEEFTNTDHVATLRIAAEEQFQRLKENIADLRDSYSSEKIHAEVDTNKRLVEIDERIDGLRLILSSGLEQISDAFGMIKVLIFEHQWEHEFRKEVTSTMIHDYIRGLHHEFEAKLYEQKGLIETMNLRWHKKITEFTTLRKELDAISTSLIGSEMGMLFTHSSRESFEEVNVIKRNDGEGIPSHQVENGNLEAVKSVNSDDFVLDVADFLYLKHKPSEEIMKFFISEMTKLRRQHDVALQEKTEELFRLKREFHKEKGTVPFRKDKEFELVRRKVSEVVSKLDEIVFNSADFPVISKDCEEICRLKDRNESLFFENQHLRSLLSDKRKEVKHLSSQVSDAASKMSLHSSLEATLLKQVKNLKGEVEDLKVEGNVKDVVDRSILRGIFNDYSCFMEDIEIQNNIMQVTYSILLQGVFCEALSPRNPAMQKYFDEKASLKETLLEKEKALSLANEENQRMKQETTSLSVLINEKDQLALEARSSLIQQKEQYDIVCHDLNILRDQVGKQEKLISDFRKDSDSMKTQLDEAFQLVLDYELEISKQKQDLNTTTNALDEAEKQNLLLCGIVEEKQRTLSSSVLKDKEQVKWLECSMFAMAEMSKAFDDFKNKMQEKIRRNENRLKTLSHRCRPLVQQAVVLKKKVLWYKQMLEIRCSDLQKAEAEVDLLGDEVDSLLSLLGKIYIALDHYSPVLQHYPGVMEVLKLVQRELKGESIGSM
uniref:WPP domain-associated protein n=1 Tax=Ananas comosus var. bracteatus TaxID=296719 RepID=A0A6V7QEJ5_ANACO|nr:unnamed protein product [Ananas comosus var. bracteatus]